MQCHPTSAGGTRHYNFARHLIQKGHEVVIVAANYDHFSHAFIKATSKAGELDHRYDVPFMWIPVPSYRGNTIKRFWNMLVFSFNILRNKYLPRNEAPDVIIGSSPHLFAAFGAASLSQKTQKTICFRSKRFMA